MPWKNMRLIHNKIRQWKIKVAKKSIEDDINQKNDRIVELENDVNKQEDDISNLKKRSR